MGVLVHIHTQLSNYLCTVVYMYIALHNDIVTMQHTVKPYFESQSKCRSCTFLIPCEVLLISVLEYPKQCEKTYNY